MVQPAAASGALDLESGRLDFSSFGGLAAAYQVGSHSVVVETMDRREIRITARRDLTTAAFVSEYERRSIHTVEKTGYPIWTRTTAYPPAQADSLEACLEAAMQEVSRASGH